MTRNIQLFASPPRSYPLVLSREAHEAALGVHEIENVCDTFCPTVDERTLEVYERAHNPTDPFELRNLWLGRVEHELGPHSHRSWLAEQWCAVTKRRQVAPS